MVNQITKHYYDILVVRGDSRAYKVLRHNGTYTYYTYHLRMV